MRAYLACLTLVVACQRADPPAPSAETTRTSAEAKRPAAGSREAAAHSHPIDQDPRLGAEWKAAREQLAIKTQNSRWLWLIARELVLDLGKGCRADADCTVFGRYANHRVEIARRHREEFFRRMEEFDARAHPRRVSYESDWRHEAPGTCTAEGRCAVHTVPTSYQSIDAYTDPVFRGEQPLELDAPLVWPFSLPTDDSEYQMTLDRLFLTCELGFLGVVLADVTRHPAFVRRGELRAAFHLGGGTNAANLSDGPSQTEGYLPASLLPKFMRELRPFLTLLEKRCGRAPSVWPCWADQDECPPGSYISVNLNDY